MQSELLIEPVQSTTMVIMNEFDGQFGLSITRKDILEFIDIKPIANCYVTDPFYLERARVRHTLFFNNVVFRDKFSLAHIVDNKHIILQNCIFNGPVNISGIKNKKIIIKNCEFKSDVHFSNINTGYVELFENIHYEDAVIEKSRTDLYFVGDVKMVGNHIIFLNDFNVKSLMINYSI